MRSRRLRPRGPPAGTAPRGRSARRETPRWAPFLRYGMQPFRDRPPRVTACLGSAGLAAMRSLLLGLLALAVVACFALPAQAATRWIQPRAPLNMAHQGGEDEFPSNTMYAFRKARRAGAPTCLSSTSA
jgi:hypothetical protein